jgi:plastocyanin
MTRPSMLWLALALALSVSESAAGPAAASIAGTVTTGGGKPADRAVVYLEGVHRSGGGANPKLAQRELQFSDRMVVIETGTTVEFPNEDKVFHNVFSISAAMKFDLGLYKSGTSKSVTFRSPGEIDVFCNIHPEMRSLIEVVDSSHHAVTGADGRFRLDGVPPGRYTLVARQPHGEDTRTEVRVTAAGATVAVQIKPGIVRRRHLRKDGTPYGVYK